jgi:peptidyl-tRNA hydrolase
MAAVQAVHAAGESSPGLLPEGTYAVVLAVNGSAELEQLSSRLQAAGIRHKQIRESDEPYRGELMALGLEPAPRSVLKKYLSSLRLLR